MVSVGLDLGRLELERVDPVGDDLHVVRRADAQHQDAHALARDVVGLQILLEQPEAVR
ncbi:MAG: hypothetical protein WDN24_14415 [Sphingomonas sp.]